MRVTKQTFPHWQSIACGFMKVDFGSQALFFKRNERNLRATPTKSSILFRACEEERQVFHYMKFLLSTIHKAKNYPKQSQGMEYLLFLHKLHILSTSLIAFILFRCLRHSWKYYFDIVGTAIIGTSVIFYFKLYLRELLIF